MWSSIYDCRYTCSGDLIHESLRKEACFGYVFRNLPAGKVTIDYKIYLALFDKDSNSNFCTPKETRYILKQFKKVVPFTYKLDLTPVMIEGKPYCTLNLHISGERIIHKFILTMTRYFFEYPNNVIAKDAVCLYHEILKKAHVGNSINWINVALIVESFFTGRDSIHCFTHPYVPTVSIMSLGQFKERINSKLYVQVNDLFQYGETRYRCDEFTTPDTPKLLNSIKERHKRVTQYAKRVKLLKQAK